MRYTRSMTSLKQYGWNTTWDTSWQQLDLPECIPARVIADHGSKYQLATPEPVSAALAGALAHKLAAYNMPKIGDWVAVEVTADHLSTIHAILPRHSEISRGQIASRQDKQVIAANVDIAFIVQPLDHDFSPERLERYLFQLSGQPIDVVILLNKADAVTDALSKQAEIKNLGVKTIIMSALEPVDVKNIATLITSGKTAVFLGSSGAGKSTLTNKLLGEVRQATQAVRERDSKGKHTTVHRELFALPNGGMIIDMPGIRELQLWGDYADLEQAFPEIATAIRSCHFPHCSHTNEAGCAVKEGLQDGTIDPIRYERFKNFKAELQLLDEKRGFIEKRKEAYSRETAKRLRARKQRTDEDKHDSWQ
jgi:ribosome biogenesis GTPase